VDVQLLQQQIEAAQAQLDALDAEAEEFEADVDFQVREPMERIDSLRRQMAAERAHLVLARPELSETIAQRRRENERLMAENKELRGKIVALEIQKRKLPSAVAAAVEELTLPSPRPMILFEKRIIKPLTSARRNVRGGEGMRRSTRF
jgi:cell division protein FtsB